MQLAGYKSDSTTHHLSYNVNNAYVKIYGVIEKRTLADCTLLSHAIEEVYSACVCDLKIAPGCPH